DAVAGGAEGRLGCAGIGLGAVEWRLAGGLCREGWRTRKNSGEHNRTERGDSHRLPHVVVFPLTWTRAKGGELYTTEIIAPPALGGSRAPFRERVPERPFHPVRGPGGTVPGRPRRGGRVRGPLQRGQVERHQHHRPAAWARPREPDA